MVIVKTESVVRCDYSVALLENGMQKERHEFRGDVGEAAAQALALSSRNEACKIVAAKAIMDIVNQ